MNSSFFYCFIIGNTNFQWSVILLCSWRVLLFIRCRYFGAYFTLELEFVRHCLLKIGFEFTSLFVTGYCSEIIIFYCSCYVVDSGLFWNLSDSLPAYFLQNDLLFLYTFGSFSQLRIWSILVLLFFAVRLYYNGIYFASSMLALTRLCQSIMTFLWLFVVDFPDLGWRHRSITTRISRFL